ncbi:MAG: ABC transporter permease [Chloroflexota bacterium]|nr:ABC transporter permease [Chloroflexota bacterium]
MSEPRAIARPGSTGARLAKDTGEPRSGRALRRGARRFLRASPVGAISLLILLGALVIAVMADRIAPYDPLVANFIAIGKPPSAEHLLGTDQLGRDVLSRIIYGTRLTLLIAVAAVAVGDSIGFLWGLVAGYAGGKFDLVSLRLLDLMMAFPALILAMLLLAGMGSGVLTVTIAIAVTRIPGTTRVIRSIVLSTKEMAFVDAARAIGVQPVRILAKHIAPQCVAPMLVLASLNLGTAIFAEAALSFLGVGTPPPAPTWGSMLGGVLAGAFRPPWWLVLAPGLAITLTIMAANLLGDALRDFLDPRLRSQMH